MRWARLAAALGVAAAATVTVGHADAATGCADNTWDRWNLVRFPSASVRSIAQLDSGSCAFVVTTGDAIVRSSDGGRSWNVVERAPVTGPIWAEGLGSTVVAPFAQNGTVGLLVSTDGGWTFGRRPSPDPGVALVTGGGSFEGPALYALAPHDRSSPAGVTGGPITVYRSNDDGATWSAVPGSAAVPEPRAFGSDLAGDGSLWIAGSAPGGVAATGGVFHLTADGAVVPVRDDLADAVVADHYLADQTETVLVATAYHGLVRSSDGGTTWDQVISGRVTQLRTDPGRVNAIVAVSDGVVMRSTDDGRTWRDWSAEGLPAACEPTGLTRTATLPAAYLVWCGRRAYVLPSSGLDLVGTDFTRPPPPLDVGISRPMRVVGEPIDLSGPRASDGSLAFDGRVLYWSDGGGYIHRMVLATRKELPTYVVTGTGASLAVDPIRQLLYVWEPGTREMSVLDIATGKSHVLFTVEGARYVASWSWDWQRNAFYAIQESGATVFRLDLTGQVRTVCNVPVERIDAPVNDGFLGAAYVAIGGGVGLVEGENDKDVLRVDAACNILERQYHPKYSEAMRENDTLVCDGVTFGEPVVWIRDAERNVATAYAARGAYCPLPTKTTILAPTTVAAGRSVRICGRLGLHSDGSPIAGQPLVLLADGRAIGRGTTDSAGRVCGRFRSRAGSLAVRRIEVSGVFLGTQAYLSSSARDALDVLPQPRPRPAPRPEVDVLPPPLPRSLAGLGLAEPPPPVQLNPNPLPNPNLNPNPNPQAMPQGALGYVGQEQPQQDLARADERTDDVTYEMSARDRESALALLAGAAVLSAIALGAARRRARTSVATCGGARSRYRYRS